MANSTLQYSLLKIWLAINWVNSRQLENLLDMVEECKKNKKKFMFVPAGQDHFRSRHSGSSKMSKRGYTVADKTLKRTIRRAVPHV